MDLLDILLVLLNILCVLFLCCSFVFYKKKLYAIASVLSVWALVVSLLLLIVVYFRFREKDVETKKEIVRTEKVAVMQPFYLYPKGREKITLSK